MVELRRRKMKQTVSIAIETSCRPGGVALGVGDELIRAEVLDVTGRHAARLISHLDRLLSSESIRPRDIKEVYVSAGPGSFTGLRIGITVARTLAQARACGSVGRALVRFMKRGTRSVFKHVSCEGERWEAVAW